MNLKGIALIIGGFALTLCFLLPNYVRATSGACSYHDGVDCSAGADWDGSVVCNDGWRDSSVSYSSSSTCTETCPWGYTDEFKEILVNCFQTDSDHLKELKASLEYYKTVEQQYINEQNEIKTNELTSEVQSQLIKINSMIGGIRDLIREYEGYINDSESSHFENCKTMAETIGKYYCNSDVYITVCPDNASLKNSECACDYGYYWDGAKGSCDINVVSKTSDYKSTNVSTQDISEEQEVVVEEAENKGEAFATISSDMAQEEPKEKDSFFYQIFNGVKSFFSKLKFW